MRVEIDLQRAVHVAAEAHFGIGLAKLDPRTAGLEGIDHLGLIAADAGDDAQSGNDRSEEHTSELQSLMRISYAVFCLKKKNIIMLIITHQILHELVKDTITTNENITT